MSKSYRHTPVVKDNSKGASNDKRIAAQRLRAIPVDSEESQILASSPSSYKKINGDSWDIHDYVLRWTREEAINEYKEAELRQYKSFLSSFPTLENYLNYWEHCMYRK